MTKNTSGKNTSFGFFKDFIRERKNAVIILVMLLGLILAALSLSLGNRESEAEAQSDMEVYKKKLEGELSELCSQVSGAGKCIVSVSFASGEEREYRGSQLISVSPPKVSGITVLARGGANDSVRGELSEMLSALYGIGHNRICILKLS